MAEIIDQIKNYWKAFTLPDGVNKDYDEKCDNAFDRALDRFINLSYFVFFVFSIISIYFFITREIL